jgi:type IV secretion system protein TrbL
MLLAFDLKVIRLLHKHKFIFLLMLFACLFFSSSDAQATDILDKIVRSYRDASSGWFNKLFVYAKRLFWLLAAIEFAWAATTWVLEKDNMNSLTAALIKKIMGISIFYALLLYAGEWMPAIVNSLKTAGQSAANIRVSTPSQVIDLGINIANLIWEAIKKQGIMGSFAAAFICGFSAIIIVVSFTVVAAQLMIALIESYIVISAGVLFLGFGGSRWTVDFAQKYISYAFSVGVKLFILYLILGLGMSQAATWQQLLTNVDAVKDTVNILAVLGASVVLCFLCYQTPSMAASMLSGSPSLTAGSAAQAGGMMMAGAAAAVSPVLSAARGGMQATSSGYSLSREGGSGMLAAAVGGLGHAGAGMATEVGRSIGSAVGLVKPSSSGSSTIGGRAAESIDNKTQGLREQKAAMGGSVGANSGGNNSSSASSQTKTGTSASGASSNTSTSSGTSSSGGGSTGQTSSASTVPPPNNTSQTAQSGKQHQQQSGGNDSSMRISPPNIPNDSAPPSNVQIKFGHSED